MPAFKDLTNLRFGKLFVVRRSTNIRFKGCGKTAVRWICICDCGIEKRFLGSSLRSGNTKSCGCLANELTSKRCKLGYTETKEYKAWHSMRRRCSNKNNKDYHRYGGRGIVVCEKWEKSFLEFLKDIGKAPSPKHSIDRINNDGNYEPGNCRWATMKEQGNNRSNSRKYKKTLCLRERLDKIRQICNPENVEKNLLKDIMELTS